MNISYNWLKKYIDIPYSPEELVERLTMCGIEVESISEINVLPEGLIVAEILERTQHPNADKLSVCKVSTGTEELQVVCGAPNCDAGKKVCLATVGTVFDDDGKKFKIKKSKLRGEESHGMLCSSSELGLDDDHSGIMELDLNLSLGTPISELYESDTVFELEITSNRPDWLSYLGIARDIQALSGNKIKMPEINLSEVKVDQDYSNLIKVKNDKLCPRFTGRVIRGVEVKESPDWLKQALISIGLRPINNIVDISNYVLFELGQPLHIYDLDELKENRLIIRRAHDGEKVVTLDEKECKMTSDNLVIADAEDTVCIGGVMGAEHSGVSEKTRNVLVECAFFDKTNIRKTSKKLGLMSDSSQRFERGVDVNMVPTANDRASSLVLELAGGTLCSELIDVKNENNYPKPKTVKCNFDNIRAFLGTDISNTEMIEILKRLDLGVENITEVGCDVVATTFRLDVEREADISEEIIRIYGLDKVPVVDVYTQPGGSTKDEYYLTIAEARDQIISLGFTECVNYTLIDKELLAKDKSISEENYIEIKNPISSEMSVMRPSLLTGIMQNLERNVSHNNHELKLFEIGNVYTSDKKYNEERNSCCIALSGKKHPERYSEERDDLYDFYDLKGLLESWLAERKIENIVCEKSTNPIFKSGVAADMLIDGKNLISFGEVSKEFTKGIRLRAPLYVAVIELDEILKMKKGTIQYTEVAQFPATSRDVAVLVDKTLANSEIIDCIKSSKCSILEKVEVVDVYEGKSIGSDKKSIAYSLTYRNLKKTLTDKEVNKAHDMIRAKLQKNLPLELR